MKSIIPLFLLTAICFSSCADNKTEDQKISNQDSDQVQVKEEAVSYQIDTTTFGGYVAYDENKEGKRPVVLVVHEWWGLNDYVRGRAKQLAEMGYLAMAVDMFGSGKTADNPGDAEKLVTPFKDPKLAKTRLDAAFAKAKEYTQADTANVAAIGYCFGGYVVLNAAKLGTDLDGVVSFHGGLGGAPISKDLLKAKIFVAHGGADPFVPEVEVAAFKKGMDSISADYKFSVYPNATHAFTNPNATETGKKFNIPIAYNAAADSASWKDMKEFFGRVFK
jgi:dienelactone hydrolase